MTADTILALAAFISAAAGLVKAFISSDEVKKLKETIVKQDEKITKQGERIALLETENKELCDKIMDLQKENDELREQNSVINAVNSELRRLLDGKMKRNTGSLK